MVCYCIETLLSELRNLSNPRSGPSSQNAYEVGGLLLRS